MQYDLIIVGGGLVGAGLAAALQATTLRIALIDARMPSNDDARLFGLNNNSVDFLKSLKVWSSFASHATAIHQVHVSHRGHFGAVRLDRDDANVPALGYVIPARHIEKTLNERLMQLTNVTVYRPATLVSLVQDKIATLTIQTQDGMTTLQAPIVIGADGAESTVRTQLGIAIKTTDYAQRAIVFRTTLQRSHQHIAYERFNAHGAIAMLPLGELECATIWSADNDIATQLINLSDDAFMQALQEEFGFRLGRFVAIGQRFTYPLKMVCAEKAVEGCVLLMGNAAHTLHPIAAQGFNLALCEVAALVEGIIRKDDLSCISAKTKKQQAISIGVSHRLPVYFAKQSILFNMGLQMAMMALDVASPIKRRFIRAMMGKTG
jgi:2-octaprenyl-6-methoxyphenol hydroxylase